MDPRVDPSDASDLVVNELYPVALKQARNRVVMEGVLVPLVAGTMIAATVVDGRGHEEMPIFGAALVVTVILAFVRDLRWFLWLRRASTREAYGRLQAGDADGGPFSLTRAQVPLFN